MKYIVTSLMLVTLIFAANEPRTAVFSFTTTGIDEATGKTATSIFRSELAATGKFFVIDIDEIKNTIGNDDPVEGINSASEKALMLNSSKAVIGNLSKLGDQTLIEVKLIDVSSKTVEFTDRLGSVTGTDFDIILSRLAKGVAERKKSEATAEVGKIIKKEAEQPSRRASFITGSTRIGVMFPISGFGDNSGVPIGGAVSANYETDKFMAEMAYTYYGLSGYANFGSFEISAFKLTSLTDVCPYWGGGFGYGSASSGLYSSSRLAPVINLGGGVMFLRTYDFRLILDARYRISFSKIEDWDWSYYSSRVVSTVQNSLSISLGLMYRRTTSGGCCLFF